MVDSLVLLIPFVFGAVIGSFLNVVILRSLKGEPLTGRSHCPHCERPLAWYEMIPILSFILLRGRCRTCAQEISIQYPLVELLSAIGAMVLFPDILAIAFFLLLLVLFMIDLRSFLLPDFFVVLLGTLAFLSHAPSYTGMLIGGGFLLFLWVVTSGQGIGFGDVKLALVLGLWFGVAGIVTLLAGAFIIGGLFGATLLLQGQATRKTAIPFGPFLTGVAMLLLMFPQLTLFAWSTFMPGLVFG